mmetsp:Transcript_35072/g.96973  ORF Transcript_35072/g.96973 Transcript_35072/m.96973 type:complete len:235 (+) Transcript_35072:138-842(+)
MSLRCRKSGALVSPPSPKSPVVGIRHPQCKDLAAARRGQQALEVRGAAALPVHRYDAVAGAQLRGGLGLGGVPLLGRAAVHLADKQAVARRVRRELQACGAATAVRLDDGADLHGPRDQHGHSALGLELCQQLLRAAVDAVHGHDEVAAAQLPLGSRKPVVPLHRPGIDAVHPQDGGVLEVEVQAPRAVVRRSGYGHLKVRVDARVVRLAPGLEVQERALAAAVEGQLPDEAVL